MIIWNTNLSYRNKIKSENKRDYISRNNVDNDTMEHEFEVLNSRNESKDKRNYISSNNTMEHEIEQQHSKRSFCI